MPRSARQVIFICFLALPLALGALVPQNLWAQALECQPEDSQTPAAGFATSFTKAENGDSKAQCEVGVAFLNGSAVAQDFRKGLLWLKRSSDAGFGYARYVLADVYSRGFAGVPANDETTYYYASLAAASSSLPDKYRERAVKLRDASAKRLTPAQLTSLQAKAALAPLDAVSDK